MPTRLAPPRALEGREITIIMNGQQALSGNDNGTHSNGNGKHSMNSFYASEPVIADSGSEHEKI